MAANSKLKHDVRCKAHDKPDYYYGLADPDSEGHCLECHCICNPDGPNCGHIAGCPGC